MQDLRSSPNRYESIVDPWLDSVQWLLEPENPLVRYNTLRFLLDTPLADSQVQDSLQAMLASPPIKEILAHQNPDGGFFQDRWLKKHNPSYVQIGYLPKYVASTWNALFLAQCAVPETEPAVQRLGKHLLQTTYNIDAKTICFPELMNVGTSEQRGYGAPCFIGNMLWVLCQFGLGQHRRVRNTFRFLVKYQLYNRGRIKTPSEFPYRGPRDRCWGGHSCYWGVTKVLRAMTGIPTSYWSSAAKVSRDEAIQFVLAHHLIRKCRDPTRWVIPTEKYRSPIRFLVPRTYSSDAIEIATSLLKLGVDDPRIGETIDYILSRQTTPYRWQAEPHPGRFYGTWITTPQENKWITFRIMYLLKLAKRISVDSR